jgi:Flp pilus assembly protein TadG
MFGLALLPLIGIAGAAVDYSTASTTRARMMHAADAAVLAVAKPTNLTNTQRDTRARKVFDTNMANFSIGTIDFKVKDISSGVRIEVAGGLDTRFMSIMGLNKMPLDVASEVTRGEGFVEVALVLDNTYSMVNDMAGLKTASTNFINTLFSSGAASGSLKMGIVPYVATVNTGRTNLRIPSVDIFAQSPFHASILRNKPAAFMTNCDPHWGGGLYMLAGAACSTMPGHGCLPIESTMV